MQLIAFKLTIKWFSEPEAEVEYEGSAGDLCAITDDVWVSPTGSDNTGDATQNNPIRTIKYALEIIAPSDDCDTSYPMRQIL